MRLFSRNIVTTYVLSLLQNTSRPLCDLMVAAELSKPLFPTGGARTVLTVVFFLDGRDTSKEMINSCMVLMG